MRHGRRGGRAIDDQMQKQAIADQDAVLDAMLGALSRTKVIAETIGEELGTDGRCPAKDDDADVRMLMRRRRARHVCGPCTNLDEQVALMEEIDQKVDRADAGLSRHMKTMRKIK